MHPMLVHVETHLCLLDCALSYSNYTFVAAKPFVRVQHIFSITSEDVIKIEYLLIFGEFDKERPRSR